MTNHLYLFRLTFAFCLAAFLAACSGDPGDTSSDQLCNSLADCAEGERCNAQGVCTAETLACTRSLDCEFDEYCAEGQCAPAACGGDDECVAGHICEQDACREGCRPGAGQCGQGQVCDELTLRCEDAGCTPTSCRARVQTCDETLDPPACVFTGACDDDTQCVAYGRQVNDGNEYICDPNSRQCVVKPPCESDDDCRVGQICEEREGANNICREGCRANDDCRIGELCSEEQGLTCIAGCGSDEDCEVAGDGRDYFCRDLQCIPVCNTVDDCSVVGQICTGSPRHCQGCTDDGQCRSTQFCDFAEGATEAERDNPAIGLCRDLPPDCPEDAFGDNHSRDRAYEITSFPFELNDEGDEDTRPYFCRQNTGGDWFQIQANAQQVIAIDLAYDMNDGNLDIALFRQDGTEVVASARPPNVDQGTESIRYGVDLGATFLVQVRGSIVKKNARYALTINVADPEPCAGDNLDPNTEDNPANLDVATPYQNLQVCSDTSDYYQLSAGENMVVRVTLEAPVRLGNLNMNLYDAQGNRVAQTNAAEDSETLYYATTNAEDMTLEVYVSRGVGNVNYEIEWVQNPNQCTDLFESNDTCGEAAVLDAGTFTDLALCADQDHYQFELLPLQTITIAAVYDPRTAAGELDLSLFGPNDCLKLLANGTEIERTDTGMVAETITFQAERGGTYYLLAYLFQGLNVPYTLEVDIQDGPPCDDDLAEPNDSPAESQVITPAGINDGTEAALIGLRICDENADWYSIDLQEGDKIEWHVLFNHANGDLDAYLLAPDGQTILAPGDSEDNDEIVTYTAGPGEAGTYYLKVEGKHPVRTDYRVLSYLNDVGPENPACPDRFGANTAREDAVELLHGDSYDQLMVCGSPRFDDWYKTLVQPGETLTVDVAYSEDHGRVDLHMFDDTGSQSFLVRSTSNSGHETVSFTSPREQYLYYRVSTQSSVAWNIYEVSVNVDGAPACTSGSISGHNDLTTAAELETPGLYPRLRLCETGDDWYAVDLDDGQKFEAFIRFDGRQADLDLYVLGPDVDADDPLTTPPVVLGSGETTTSDESVTITAAAAGTYYVQVTSKVPARLDYDLLLYSDTDGDGQLVGPADRVCPDPYEDNDTLTSAALVSPGTYDDLLVCWGNPNDNDYYAVFVPAGASLTATAIFSHDEGNLQMRVYRGSQLGAPIAGESASSTDDETVTVTNSGLGETYVVHVYGTNGPFRNYYSLDLSLSFAGDCDDAVEAGLSKGQAQVLAVGSYDDLSLCEGGEHWYKLDLVDGDRVHVELEFNKRFGHIDMELLDSGDNVIASSTSSSNWETIDATVSAPDTYYLRVYPKDAAFVRTSYNMWASVAGADPSTPFCTDPYERNDSSLLAFPLPLQTQSQYTDMRICGDREDWYSVDLTGNRTYDFNVFFGHSADFDLAVEVRNASGDLVNDNAQNPAPISFATHSSSNDETVQFKAPTTGTYFLGVRNAGTNPAQGDYLMYFRDTVATCPDDSFEPNNSLSRPATLPQAGLYAMGSCTSNTASSEDDYFTFTATHDGTVELEVIFNSELVELSGHVDSFAPNMDSSVPNRLTYSQAVSAGDSLFILIGNVSGKGPYFLRVTH